MLCNNCGVNTKNIKYCSQRCAAIMNNKLFNRNRLKPQGKCVDCGTAVRMKKVRCTDCRRIRHEGALERKNKRNKQNVTEWRRKIKRDAVALKGGVCERCGYGKCIKALQFHHRDPSEKDFQLSGRMRAWSKVLREIAKCDLLCSNCHAEVHDGQALAA